MKRILLIIGAQKSGTTSLFHYLSEHPQICPSREKEPFFFADDRRCSKGLQSYFSLWDWQDQHRIAMEASVVYTMQPMYSHVAERIAQVKDIDFSFIYIMRNPLKRIESHVIHSLSTGYLKHPEVTSDSVCFSKYAYQLDPFVEKFGRDKLHLLLLEDLQRHPEIELQKIYDFLGLDSQFKGTQYDQVYNGKQASHFRLPPRLRKIYQSPMIKATIGRLPPSFRRSFYRFIPQSKRQDFSLNEKERQEILQELNPDLQRLRDEYGVDFEQQWNLSLGQFS